MYANGQNLPDGFITWQQGGGSANAITTIGIAISKKQAAMASIGGVARDNLCFNFRSSMPYRDDTQPASRHHADQSGGPQKMWNNLGYNPDAGTQGFGAWDPIFPSSTCQHVFIGPTSTTAYTINDGSALGFSPTNKFIFHNNHHNAIRGLYPNYIHGQRGCIRKHPYAKWSYILLNVYAPTSSEVIAFRHEWTPHGVCEIGAGDGTWLAALNQGGIDAIAACFFEIAILNDRAAAGPRCTVRRAPGHSA